MSVRDILETYEEITIGEQILEDILFFTLFEKTIHHQKQMCIFTMMNYWIFHI